MRMELDDDFAGLVGRWAPALLRVAFPLTGDHGRAEDLLQTALGQTSRRWRRLADRDYACSYVRKVLVITHASWHRRRRAPEVLLAQLPDVAAPTPGDDPAGLGSALTALEALPPRMRAVIVLRFYEDLTEADTAAALGCSTGSVKGQSSRGLARLRNLERPRTHPDGTRGATMNTDEVRAALHRDADLAGRPDPDLLTQVIARRRRTRHRRAGIAATCLAAAIVVAVAASV